MIRLPELFIEPRARDGTWCRLPYPGHPKGCPNFPKCTEKHPDINALPGRQWFAVTEEFDLKGHAEMMAEKHPNWTDRQCRNLLYWQGGVRKRLYEKTVRDFDPFSDVLLKIPEASGINVFDTMAGIGVHIQRTRPEQIVKVMMIGKPI